LKFKTDLVETQLPTSSRKQLTKLGNIFTCREGSDDFVCQIYQEACADSVFTTGKRWDDWKIDYLKRHINQKIHLDLVTKLRCQKSGGLQRLVLTGSAADRANRNEASLRRNANADEVKILIDDFC